MFPWIWNMPASKGTPFIHDWYWFPWICITTAVR
jgi:hypothetical protein